MQRYPGQFIQLQFTTNCPSLGNFSTSCQLKGQGFFEITFAGTVIDTLVIIGWKSSLRKRIFVRKVVALHTAQRLVGVFKIIILAVGAAALFSFTCIRITLACTPITG